VPSTGKYWPEDGLEKTETCSHTWVLMVVRFCFVSTEKKHIRLDIKNTTGFLFCFNGIKTHQFGY
jgi:hypothetical protein